MHPYFLQILRFRVFIVLSWVKQSAAPVKGKDDFIWIPFQMINPVLKNVCGKISAAKDSHPPYARREINKSLSLGKMWSFFNFVEEIKSMFNMEFVNFSVSYSIFICPSFPSTEGTDIQSDEIFSKSWRRLVKDLSLKCFVRTKMTFATDVETFLIKLKFNKAFQRGFNNGKQCNELIHTTIEHFDLLWEIKMVDLQNWSAGCQQILRHNSLKEHNRE